MRLGARLRGSREQAGAWSGQEYGADARQGGHDTRSCARPRHGNPQRCPWSENPLPCHCKGCSKDRRAGRRRHGGFRLVRYETGTVPERPSGAREPPGRGTVPTGWGPPPTPAPPPGPRSPAERGPRDLSAPGGIDGPAGAVDGEWSSTRSGFGLAGSERWGSLAVRRVVTDGDQAEQGHPLECSRQGVRVPPSRASNHPLGQGRGRIRGCG